MAKKILTSLDLSGNQILGASFEKLTTDPVSGNFKGRMYFNTTDNIIKVYDGASWAPVGDITNVQGTTNEIDVSVDAAGVATIGLPDTIYAELHGNASTATTWATGRKITLDGDLSGEVTIDGSEDVTLTATIASDSVALGTDTTGDYVANITAGTGIGIDYTSGEGSSPTITNNGVTEIYGTTDQISVDVSTGSVTVSFPTDVTFPGTVTLDADPVSDLQAVTKQYVDAKINGLTWKQAANVLATVNVPLTGSTPLVVDSHTLSDGYRVVLTNQTTGTQNGIYTLAITSGSYTLSRTADGDAYGELVGASIFIEEGTAYGKTSWVQANHYLTSFADQNWYQISGQGTYIAGNGLSLSGGTFSIDTDITVDIDTAQTLTNKTIDDVKITGSTSFRDGGDVEYLSIYRSGTGTARIVAADDLALRATNDIILYPGNDVGGHTGKAYIHWGDDAYNAYPGREIATIGTSQTFSNKTLDTPVIIGDGIVFEGATTNSYQTTLNVIDPTDDRTITLPDADGSLTLKASASVGNGTDTSFNITHDFNTKDVIVQVYDRDTYDTVDCDVVRTTENYVTVSFSSAPTTNEYRVVIIG